MSIVSKANTLTQAGKVARPHGTTLTDREAKAVETAESFAPSVGGNWTATVTTQDAALNQLAAREKAKEVMTAVGDLIQGGVAGAPTRLAIGAANAVLKSDGVDAEWGSIADANISASAAIATSKLAGSAATQAADALVRYAVADVTAAQLVAAGSGVAHACFGSAAIPDNAIILDGMVDIGTTFQGDGDDSSTISIGVNSGVDIVATVDIKDAGAPWDAGLHDIIPVGSAATAVKLTAARDISVTWTAVATDTTLVAGAMRIILRYVMGS